MFPATEFAVGGSGSSIEAMVRTESLVAVLYSAGKVFEGLQAGRLETEAFLRGGDSSGIASRADLQLLEDLQEAGHVVAQAKREKQAVSAELVCTINRAMTRSAAIHPGQLRTDDQRIGVRTSYGNHLPPGLTMDQLQGLIENALTVKNADSGPRNVAARLFVVLARAQPFEDGNKRTALLAANVYLPGSGRSVIQNSCGFDPQGHRLDDLLGQQKRSLVSRR